jgi:ComF family protein
MFSIIWKTFLDAFFPIRCLRCKTFDHWICAQCHSTLPIIIEQQCPLCKKHVTTNGDVCLACIEKHNPPYDGVFVASYFKDPLVRKMIHNFKYRFAKNLSQPLALLMAQSLHNSHFPAPDLIIPVPLHPRRLRWRGFNQAEEIARSLDLRIPLNTDILKRIRYTHPQVTMRNKKSRENNVQDAFALHDPSLIRGKNILLVDDIMTTGATIMACATVLKNSGAGKIYAIVIARE